MSDTYEYLKGFKPSSEHTAATGKAMDGALAALRDKKGELWAGLVEYATMTRMMNRVSVQNELTSVMTRTSAKLLTLVIRDKFPNGDSKDRLVEMMDDADDVLEAILIAAAELKSAGNDSPSNPLQSH